MPPDLRAQIESLKHSLSCAIRDAQHHYANLQRVTAERDALQVKLAQVSGRFARGPRRIDIGEDWA